MHGSFPWCLFFLIRSLTGFITSFVRTLDKQFLLVQEREGRKFVNVDLSTVEGLSRAKDLKLASS